MANRLCQFASFCSRKGLHPLPSQADLIRGRGVAGYLAQGRVTADGSYNVGAAADLGQAPAGCLAQSVHRSARRKASLAAFTLEPMREGVGVKLTAAPHRQEREMVGRRGVDYGPQFAMQWDC